MTLVAHLRGNLGFRGALGELPGFVDGPTEGLLHVNVLVQIHGGESDGRVHVIGRGDDDGVDVLLLFQHFAIVRIALGLGQHVVLQVKNLRQTSLGFCGFFWRHGGTGFAGMINMTLQVRNIGIQAREVLVRVVPIDIANRHDILAGQIDHVAAAHAADADASDIQQVTRRCKTATQYVPGQNRECRSAYGRFFDKTAPRHFLLIVFLLWQIVLLNHSRLRWNNRAL